MLLSPLTICGVLLAGGVVVAALARFRSRFSHETAVLLAGLAFFSWLPLRTRLPLHFTLVSWPGSTSLPSWSLRVDEMAWQLSAALLLLVAVALALNWNAAIRGRTTKNTTNGVGDTPISLILFTAAGGLMVLWAGSLAGLMVGWMMLGVVWAGLFLVAARNEPDAEKFLWRVGWLLLSLFFLWLAAASLPSRAGDGLIASGWQRIPTSSILTAALLQMGVWPLHAWRPHSARFSPPTAVMVHIVPALAGSSLLARLVMVSNVSTGYSLFLTGFGLLGLLLGVQRAWNALQEPARFVAAVALAQTSLALLAGVWLGAGPLIAEMLVMALSVGTLFLSSLFSDKGAIWWLKIGPALALLALMGLPLTPAFAARSALFDAWLNEGRFILALAAALMYAPLVAAVIAFIWGKWETGAAPEESNTAVTSRTDVILAVGLLLPVSGAYLLGGMPLSAASIGSWFLILLPAAGGLLIFRYFIVLVDPVRTLKAAFALRFTLDVPLRAWRFFVGQVDKSVQDATAILEGEGGLLWLLVVVVIVLLAQSG